MNFSKDWRKKIIEKRRKLLEIQNEILNKSTPELERFCDFLGNIISKYIHEIPTIFISFSNPYHLVDVPMVKTYINAYTSNKYVVHMMVEKLMGRSQFKGKNPVDPFAGLWDTRL